MYEYRRKNRHLSFDDRAKLERLYRLKYTQREIAKILGVSQPTVSRELKKGKVRLLNGDTYEFYETYSAQKAQIHADYQKTAHGPDLKIGNNRAYLKDLETCVLCGSSPYDAICTVADKKNYPFRISKTTFYRYVRIGLFERITYKHLPVGHPKGHHGKVVHQRTASPLHRSIEQRCESIATRSGFGHWELDSIVGKAKGNKESCLTITERKTRAEIVLKAKEKTAGETVRLLNRLRKYFGKHDYCLLFRSIACDNGCEFADQAGMDKTGTTVFYCHPQAPFERGSNENANKLLRRCFPKGESMAAKTQADATKAQHFLNHYHREILGGKTAAQALLEEILKLPLQHPDRVIAFFALDEM